MKGDVTINGKDAYTEWGINLEDGALSALMTPPPMKDYIESSSRLKHGTRILPENARCDAREITLPFHIIAPDRAAFFENYKKFCNDVLLKGVMEITTKYDKNVCYRLVYLSCTQFTQYVREMAIFSLKVKEPNPTNRAL